MGIKRCPADAAFSDAVRLSRGYVCEHCGKVCGKKNSDLPTAELAHIYGRRFRSVRWDTLNALCLCGTCHRDFTEAPLDFEQWLRDYVGQGYLDILNEKRHRIFKTTKEIRKNVAKHYRSEVRKMEAGPHDLVSYQ